MTDDVFIPYTEAYSDGNNNFTLAFCYTSDIIIKCDENQLGQGLIDFAELDLDSYSKQIIQLTEMPILKGKVDIETVKAFRDAVLLLNRTTVGLHPYLHFFLGKCIDEGLSLFDETVTMFFELQDEEKRLLVDDVVMIANGFIKAFYDIELLHCNFYIALSECFNQDNLCNKEMEVGNRFLNFLAKYPQYLDYKISTTYKLVPSEKGAICFEGLPKDLMDRDYFENKNFVCTNVYLLYSLEDLLYFEFSHMLKDGAVIKICKNCNRLYLVKNNYDTKYCGRVSKNGVSCSQQGAKRSFNEKLKDDVYLLEYNRIYQRLRARVGRKTMAVADFERWSAYASDMRKMYKVGNINGEEFVQKIRNNYYF